MHIPDGFLDAKTALVGAVAAGAGLALALRILRRTLPPRRVPLLGLAAAFIFAAQMLNFPVAGGTSGHLIGGTLAAVLLGPSAAVVVMTAVLILQCFLFADGGITALGANIFNMAVVGPVVGYGVFRLVSRARARGPAVAQTRARLVGTAFGAWCSTVAASILCAGELAWAGVASWRTALTAMAGVHMLIGVGEALITTLMVASVARSRPDLFAAGGESARQTDYRELAGYGLLTALGLVVFVAPFACGWPDGLERVASLLGFDSTAVASPLPAPLPDYAVPGLPASALATMLAGGIGTLAAFALACGLGRLLVPAQAPNADSPDGSAHDCVSRSA